MDERNPFEKQSMQPSSSAGGSGGGRRKEFEDYLKGLPPGYRFNPTDVELIEDYLKKKNQEVDDEGIDYLTTIQDVNVYSREPDHITAVNKPVPRPYGGQECWYFFSETDKPIRVNVKSDAGKWNWKLSRIVDIKAENHEVVGKKRFYDFCGSGLGGTKTGWKMVEFTHPWRDRWVLCKIFNKNPNAVDLTLGLGLNWNDPNAAQQSQITEDQNDRVSELGQGGAIANPVPVSLMTEDQDQAQEDGDPNAAAAPMNLDSDLSL